MFQFCSYQEDSFIRLSCRSAIKISIRPKISSEKALKTSTPILAYSSFKPWMFEHCSTWWLGQSLFSTSIFALNWSFSSMMLYMSYSATSALSSGSCVQIVLCNTFWGRICRKDIFNCQDLYNFSNTSPKLWWALALWRYNWAESKQLEFRRLSAQTPSRCTCMRCRQQYHCSSVAKDHWSSTSWCLIRL